MRFARAGSLGAERPVALYEGRWFDLAREINDFSPKTLSPDLLTSLGEAVRGGNAAQCEQPNRLGAPLAAVGSIVCVGQNYAAHAAESGAPSPELPIVFFKHHAALAGPFDDVSIPPGAEKVDWEVELSIVLGKDLYRAQNPVDALAAVAGYTISNDVSERFYQVEASGGQWSKGKSFPGFNPLGPFLVPAGEIGDVNNLNLRSWVNGEPRQDSSTGDMIFSVADLLVDLSEVMRLQPGDVINTGTPQGVAMSGRFPYLKSGDKVRLAIDFLGHQEQQFVEKEERS